jgi:acyl dehydratase
MTQSVAIDAIEVGQELPEFRRTTGFANWNRYAAVNDEFVPIHMDDEAGRAAGYPTAFGMGNLQWAYLHNLLRQWVGDSGQILRLACQFRAANTKDMTVVARGRVTAVRDEDDRRVVDLEVWTESDRGDKLAPATATVALPHR